MSPIARRTSTFAATCRTCRPSPTCFSATHHDAASGTSSSSSVYPWTATSRLYRISDVANVQDAYETQRVFAYTNGTPAIELDMQKAAGSSEVTASNAVIAQIPRLEQQYPGDQVLGAQRAVDLYQRSALGRYAHADRRYHHHRDRDAVLPAFVAQSRRRHDRGAGFVSRDAGSDATSWASRSIRSRCSA